MTREEQVSNIQEIFIAYDSESDENLSDDGQVLEAIRDIVENRKRVSVTYSEEEDEKNKNEDKVT